MLTRTARALRRTLDIIATPCSVKALGGLRVPPQLDVPDWNFKFRYSSALSCNMKSRREAFEVSAYGLVQVAGLHSIQCSKMRIEDRMTRPTQPFSLGKRRHRRLQLSYYGSIVRECLEGTRL